MATNDYHFITHWKVPAPVQEVVDILSDAESLVRWWPSVYLAVHVTDPGQPSGLGKKVKLYTKGWLPYTLRWEFVVSDIRPEGFTITASGDFVGRGIWTFHADGDNTDVTYDWKIEADKPFLRDFSFLMKPIFSQNHHWAMARGYESLLLELKRRHAQSADERAGVPDPPPATRPEQFYLGVAGIVIGFLLLLLFRRRD